MCKGIDIIIKLTFWSREKIIKQNGKIWLIINEF